MVRRRKAAAAPKERAPGTIPFPYTRTGRRIGRLKEFAGEFSKKGMFGLVWLTQKALNPFHWVNSALSFRKTTKEIRQNAVRDRNLAKALGTPEIKALRGNIAAHTRPDGLAKTEPSEHFTHHQQIQAVFAAREKLAEIASGGRKADAFLKTLHENGYPYEEIVSKEEVDRAGAFVQARNSLLREEDMLMKALMNEGRTKKTAGMEESLLRKSEEFARYADSMEPLLAKVEGQWRAWWEYTKTADYRSTLYRSGVDLKGPTDRRQESRGPQDITGRRPAA